MKLPAGEVHYEPSHNNLNYYLKRGAYEMVASRLSYNTLCNHVALTDPASVIALDGPTNGGKTSLANAFVDFYLGHGVPVAFVPLDYFLTDRGIRHHIMQDIMWGRAGVADYSSLAWEQERYRNSVLTVKRIAATCRGPQIFDIPNSYNRRTGRADTLHSIVIHPGSIIVTEGVGLHAYHSAFFDRTLWIDASDTDVILERVLERERQKSEDNRLADDFLRARYEIVDAPHTTFLRSISSVADFVVDTLSFDNLLLYKHI